MSAWTTEELEAQIAALKVLLTENAAAISATMKSQDYSLGTGQTHQRNQRAQLSQLMTAREALRQEIDELQAQLDSATGSTGSTIRVVPGW